MTNQELLINRLQNELSDMQGRLAYLQIYHAASWRQRRHMRRSEYWRYLFDKYKEPEITYPDLSPNADARDEN